MVCSGSAAHPSNWCSECPHGAHNIFLGNLKCVAQTPNDWEADPFKGLLPGSTPIKGQYNHYGHPAGPPRIHLTTKGTFLSESVLSSFFQNASMGADAKESMSWKHAQNQVLGEILKTQAADHVCPSVECPAHRASDSPSSATQNQCHLSSQNS